jgi:hypothetical protein
MAAADLRVTEYERVIIIYTANRYTVMNRKLNFRLWGYIWPADLEGYSHFTPPPST